MIVSHSVPEGIALETRVEPGETGYADADWLWPGDGRVVPHLLVSTDGSVRWGADAVRSSAPGTNPDLSAGLVLLELAGKAVEAVRLLASSGPIEVTGSGVIAARVRECLRASTLDLSTEAPEVIVETTGDTTVIVESTGRLASLGTLVLVGEAAEAGLSIDLYPDVHVRGLRIVGVAPPLADSPAASGEGSLPPLFERSLSEVSSGAVLTEPSGWYRIRSEDPTVTNRVR